jgi:hypothetical protein
MIFARSLLVTRALLSPTKKRTLFSRLPLSEPTIREVSCRLHLEHVPVAALPISLLLASFTVKTLKMTTSYALLDQAEEGM